MPSKVFSFVDIPTVLAEWDFSDIAKLLPTGSNVALDAGKQGTAQDYDDTFTIPAEYTFNSADVEVVSGILKMTKAFRNGEVFYASFDQADGDYSRNSGSLIGTLDGSASIDVTQKVFGAASLYIPTITPGELGYSAVNNVKFGAGGRGQISFWFRTTDNDLPPGGSPRNILKIFSASGSDNQIRVLMDQSVSPDKIGFSIRDSSDVLQFILYCSVDCILSNTDHYIFIDFDPTIAYAKMYVDGILRISYSGAPFTYDDSVLDDICLGCIEYQGFVGWMDDFTIYDPTIAEYVIDPVGYIPIQPTHQIYPYDPTPLSPSRWSEIDRLPAVPFIDLIPFAANFYNTFTETSIKPVLTTIMYLMSTDGGSSYLFWNGTFWQAFNPVLTPPWNTAIEITAGFSLFPKTNDDKDVTFKVILYTADPDETPELDLVRINYNPNVYWDDSPYMTVKETASFEYSSIISASIVSQEPTDTDLVCQVSPTFGKYFMRWNGTAFEVATSLWGDLNDTLANIDLLPTGNFLIKIRFDTTVDFLTPEITTITFIYETPQPNDPVITAVKSEASGVWTLSNEFGYTLSSTLYFHEANGEVTLNETSPGVFETSGSLTFPMLNPDIVKRWLRLITDATIPGNTDIVYFIRFSNDKGILGWGIKTPDYNDDNWLEIDPTNDIYATILQNVEILGDGNDALIIRADFTGDGTVTPTLNSVSVFMHLYDEPVSDDRYVAQFTTRVYVAEMAGQWIKSASDVPNTQLEAGERWVIRYLLAHGIDETQYPFDPDLRDAATYATLGIMSKSDSKVSARPGPVTSVSGDGLAKSWSGAEGYTSGGRYGAKGWFDLAGQCIDLFLARFRAGVGSASSTSTLPGFANGLARTDVHTTFGWRYPR